MKLWCLFFGHDWQSGCICCRCRRQRHQWVEVDRKVIGEFHDKRGLHRFDGFRVPRHQQPVLYKIHQRCKRCKDIRTIEKEGMKSF